MENAAGWVTPAALSTCPNTEYTDVIKTNTIVNLFISVEYACLRKEYGFVPFICQQGKLTAKTV
jgi:hypothetical protein